MSYPGHPQNTGASGFNPPPYPQPQGNLPYPTGRTPYPPPYPPAPTPGFSSNVPMHIPQSGYPNAPVGLPPHGSYPGQHSVYPPQQYPPQQYPPQQYPPQQRPPHNYQQSYPTGAPNTSSYPSAPHAAPSQSSYQSAPYGAPSQGVYSSAPHGASHHGTYPDAAQHVLPGIGAQGVYPNLSAGSYGAATPSHHGHMPATQRLQTKNPTVFPVQPFDPSGDAEALYKAMKGMGTNEKVIINVLTNRTNMQRQEIAKQFKNRFGKDLNNMLKSELSGKFEDLILGLMTPIDNYYANELYRAMSGAGTKENYLIDILCALNTSEIKAVRTAYQTLYGSPLEKAIANDTSGDLKCLLISLCSASRDESGMVNEALAETDAQKLLKGGAQQSGTDEAVFNDILCTRNYNQLKLTFNEYHKIAHHDIEEAIKKEFSGNIQDGLLAIVSVARNLPGHYAKCLHRALSGMGTKDDQLIRIIATRSEIDLGDIKQQYSIIFGKDMVSAISSDTSGDYKKCLLALLGVH